jgi:hypothetical protein
MDSLITAAARALAARDPIGALNRVALRGDTRPRSRFGAIAMAQLGHLRERRTLLWSGGQPTRDPCQLH